jgi:hypothetical protein
MEFGALQGALTFGLAPQIAGPISSAFASAGVEGASDIGAVIAQGITGGLQSVASGGNFGSGFLAGGFGSLAGPLGLSGGQFDTANLIASAALGGVAAVLGGGKFENGAVTGAFSYAASASYANDNHAPLDQFAGPGALAPAAPGFGEVLIDGLARIGSAIGVGFNALATSLFLSGDTPQDLLIPIYRAVSAEELAGIEATGQYSVPAGQVEGKYFALTIDQAQYYLNSPTMNASAIVTSSITRSTAEQLQLVAPENMPALYATPSTLPMVNGDAAKFGGIQRVR